MSRFGFVFSGLLVLFAAVFGLSPFMGGMASLVEESGPLEIGTILILAVSAAAFFVLFPRSTWLKALPVPVALLLLAKREAEQDWWIVDERLLTISFYTEEGFTATSVVGAIIAAIVVMSGLILCFRGVPLFLRAVAGKQGWALALMAAVFAAALGQVMEELEGLFVSVTGSGWLARFFEEGLELCFAYLVLVSVVLGARSVAR